MSKILIYTSVYGTDLFNWWGKAIESLKWPKNFEMTKDAEWRVWCEEANQEEAERRLSGLNYKIGDAGKMEAVTSALAEAAERKIPFLMAPPDLIWGDGSVRNLYEICMLSPCRGVAAAHVRVTPSILDELTEPKTNAQLVGVAFRHLHSAFKESEAKRMTNAFRVGTSWKEISPNLYAMTFHIPSIHMVQAIREDVEYYSKYDTGAWDHTWPTELVKKGRHKLIGSSDGAFLVELTNAGEHTKPAQQPTKAKHEGYDVYQHG